MCQFFSSLLITGLPRQSAPAHQTIVQHTTRSVFCLLFFLIGFVYILISRPSLCPYLLPLDNTQKFSHLSLSPFSLWVRIHLFLCAMCPEIPPPNTHSAASHNPDGEMPFFTIEYDRLAQQQQQQQQHRITVLNRFHRPHAKFNNGCVSFAKQNPSVIICSTITEYPFKCY